MTATTTEATPPAKATRREWLGLAVLALAALMYVMDLTVLHLAVPKMSAELQPSSAELLWIIDIYGFFVAGALITMGSLGDRIGRRRLLLIGAAAFGITSLLCAFSSTPEMLIVSRAALGIAGATLAPSTLALIFYMFQDSRERTVAIGVWIGAFSAGSAVGPILGGIMLEFFWWGSVFLIAIPVMVALLILGPRILPESRDPEAGRLDPASAIMAVGAVLAVIFGLKQIAQEGPGLLAIGAVVVGLVIGALWVRRQRQLADPMIDLALFRVPTFNAALVVNFLAIFVVVGYFLFIAQYLQLVADLTPFQAGLLSLPSAIAFIVGSQAAPRIVQRVKPAYLISGGLAFGSLGLFLLTQVGDDERATAPRRGLGRDLARFGPGVRADDRAHRRLGAPRACRGRVGDQRDGCRARRCTRDRDPRQRRRRLVSRRSPADPPHGPPAGRRDRRQGHSRRSGRRGQHAAGRDGGHAPRRRARCLRRRHARGGCDRRRDRAGACCVRIRHPPGSRDRAIRDRSGLCRADDDRSTRADPGGQAGARMLLTVSAVPILDS